jgi:hypothetical protein
LQETSRLHNTSSDSGLGAADPTAWYRLGQRDGEQELCGEEEAPVWLKAKREREAGVDGAGGPGLSADGAGPRKRLQTSSRGADMVDMDGSRQEDESRRRHYDMVYKIWKNKVLGAVDKLVASPVSQNISGKSGAGSS